MERITYVKHPHSWSRGKYPTKYTSRHTFQEVVARLAAYEDTGLMPEGIDRVFISGVIEENRRLKDELNHFQNEPNTPLTVEELLTMEGEPVWVERPGYGKRWALVQVWAKSTNVIYLTYNNGSTSLVQVELDCGGKIYCRKPEEGTV